MSPSSPQHLVFARRWAGFVSALWLMQLSGVFGFANYSTALMEVLGLNQKQLNRLSVAKDLGESCGLLAGILSNYMPAWGLLIIGATVSILGYGTQWLVVSQIISPLPYWMMFVAALLAGDTASWMNVAVLTVAVRNFPRNRGPVVGLFKAYMGLSGAIFSRICELVFSSSPSMYLLMLVVLPATFCVVSALFLRLVPPAETEEDEKEEKQSLFLFNVIASGLAFYILGISIYPPGSGLLQYVALGLLLFIVASPVLVPVFLFFRIKNMGSSLLPGEETYGKVPVGKSGVDSMEAGARDVNSEPLVQPLLTASVLDDTEIRTRRGYCSCLEPLPEIGEERGTLSLFRCWDFYVLYIALFCGIGSGKTFSNNLGQIGQSFGFSTVTLFTSFFSLGNFFGRIASGNISEYFLRLAGVPRPAWLGLAKLPMLAIFWWLATGSAASLYVGAVVVGLCHGSLITPMILTITEFYGVEKFGSRDELDGDKHEWIGGIGGVVGSTGRISVRRASGGCRGVGDVLWIEVLWGDVRDSGCFAGSCSWAGRHPHYLYKRFQ